MKTIIATLSCLLLCFGPAVAEAPPMQVPPAPASSGTAQDVETFVNLCNAGKFPEAKTSIRGYVDQRFFVKDILPFKIIPNSELNEAIASALPMAAEHAQSKQANENALLAWDELQRCANELKLELKLVTFNIQRASDPVSGVLVFVTSSKGVVFAGSLDKIGRKLARDPKDGAKEEAKALLATLKMCLYEVEQTSTGAIQKATPPEPGPAMTADWRVPVLTNLNIGEIDLAMLRKGLPQKWSVSEVRSIAAPDGWTSEASGFGIRIVVSREPYSYELGKGKDGGLRVTRPEYVICIMPRDFAGESADRSVFENGKVVAPKLASSPGVSVLGYSGVVEDGHVFSTSNATFSDWQNPEELVKEIRLKKKPTTESDRRTQTGTSEAQNHPSETLDNLSYDDPSSSDTQHPLVCGADRDFPNGRELAFRNSQSREFVHAVFPEGVVPPKDFDGRFVLQGHYQAIQNRKSYTLKQPPENYRYFLVSTWEQKK